MRPVTHRAVLSNVYFRAVTLAGTLLAVWLWLVPTTPVPFDGWVFWAMLVLGVATELIDVPLPRGGRLTTSFAIFFASLLILGLSATVTLLFGVALIAHMLVHRRHWSLAAFNFGQYTLSYSASYAVFVLAGIHPTENLTISDLPVFFAATLAYLVANVTLVNGYLALVKSAPVFRLLWEDDRWELLSTLMLGPLAALMVLLYHTHGVIGAGLLLVPLLVSGGLIVFYLKMHQQQHELAQAHQELSVLHEIAQRISSQIDLRQTMVMIGTEIRQVVACDDCLIFLKDEETQTLQAQATSSEPSTSRIPPIPLGEGPLGRVAEQSEPVHMASLDPDAYPALLGHRALLALPITSEGTTLGVIAIAKRTLGAFPPETERMLTVIASQAAVAIRNAQLYQASQQLAITDGLTGVYNRRYFQRQLEAEFRRAPRFGYSVALMLIDIDHFKRFNDTHGHLLGDQVLRSVGQILRESTRETDVVARYGGEEFAVILPETTCEQALEVAKRVRKNLARHPFWGRGQTPVKVTASIGIAARLASEIKPEELIDLADAALYEAKHGGRDRVCAADAPGSLSFLVDAPPVGTAELPPRAPSRGGRKLNEQAWQEYLLGGLDDHANELRRRLADLEVPMDEAEITRWRAALEALLRRLTAQLSQQETADSQGPVFRMVRLGVGQLISRGISLTQSESVILAFCDSIRQHVQKAPFSPQDRLHVMEVVEAFTQSMRLAVSQVWHTFYQDVNREMTFATRLEERMTRVEDLDGALAALMELAAEGTRSDMAMVLLSDTQGGLRLRASHGLAETEAIGWMLPPHEGPLGEAVASGNSRLLALTPSDPGLDRLAAWTGGKSAACFPLAHQSRPMGLLLLVSRDPEHFGSTSERLGRRLASQASVAIDRIQQDARRQEGYLDALMTMVWALEANDSEHRSHNQRIAETVHSIGQVMGLDASELAVLQQASLLHDIGEVAIPDAILRKPALLTEQERRVVETHPTVGARLIGTTSTLRDVVPVVRHHHERWNGTGYPDGLRGTEIPLLARVLAVAESFIGMTTATAYREAHDPTDALAVMRESQHFDPEVLDALAAILPSLS
ncbi:Response regulator PleD [compost metagenome]